MNYIKKGNLSVAEELLKFVDSELLPATNIDKVKFWVGFDKAVHELAPINKKLLSTREEVQKVREEKDPIDTLRTLLIEKHKISEKEFKEVDSEIKAVVTEASDFALDSPEPNIEELWTDVYAN